MKATDWNERTPTELSARIDTLGWGVLFVAFGGVGLVPDLRRDTWLVAAGLVMVGVSATRAHLRLPVSGVTTVVGILALAAGMGSIAGLARATWSTVLVVLGLTLVVGALDRSQRRTDVTSLPHGAQEVTMNLTTRDRIATLLVAMAVLIYGGWLAGVAGGMSAGAVAIVVLALGFLASASAVVPGFAALLRGSRAYLAMASLVGLVALGSGILPS